MEIKTEGGALLYEVKEGEVHIIQGTVRESRFLIPDRIENLPVTVLSKKAFLGCKNLKTVVLPASIQRIEDWAFAHCSELKELYLEKKAIQFGRGVWKDCEKLEKIEIGEGKELAGLLALVPVKLDAEYLLDLKEAGKQEWVDKLDARLKMLLLLPDEEGYLKQVLCGEEDLMSSLEVFLLEKRRQKAELCYKRLLYPYCLSSEMQSFLQEYLRNHTVGCESEAAWDLIRLEHAGEKPYYEIFVQAGCIFLEHFEELLASMGEDDPEMKAWLLQYHDTQLMAGDFFEDLLL